MASDDQPAPVDGRSRRSAAEARLEQAFDEGTLYRLRSAVAAHAAALGAGARQSDDLLVIAGELASNAIRWGGGAGQLRLWRDGQAILCRVTDSGPGLADPDGQGRQPPPVSVPNGRGLWIIRQLADRLDIRTGSAGTTITAAIELRSP
ncbi:MAG: ATP-binding protein [Micromonosporaceae bacterium]|jgi:anti-sigma regulatory factor (Ser/Thr protein kinase)|nr:ATP-binding protein [Micromonosporaceae bacterium]